MRDTLRWLDDRLPIINTFERHLSKHPVPAWTNFWYLFGAMATAVFAIQIITGVWLMMNYENAEEKAFDSVQYIMRDVELGWLLRYFHSTGASFLFIVVYLHMFRGLLYGSYRKPRELVWILGVLLFLVMMGEGFFGYVLPFGQMSYWGAQVIVSLFGAVPLIGDSLVEWFRGDYVISGATLGRFVALHAVVLPLAMVALIFLHIVALHESGAGNPDGVDLEAKLDKDGVPIGSIPFFPYKVLQAIFAISIMMILFCVVAFYIPKFFGFFLEAPNFEKANWLKTPEHIVPVWYFMPFYAMLRASTVPFLGLDAKFWGLVVMVTAILVLFILPWLDRSAAHSMRYKGMFSKLSLSALIISFISLGYLGAVPVSEGRELMTQFFTLIYFAHFLLMPLYTKYEQSRPVIDPRDQKQQQPPRQTAAPTT
ncbi:MAG: cytochrome b [Gammaproteobacteria bacterium]